MCIGPLRLELLEYRAYCHTKPPFIECIPIDLHELLFITAFLFMLYIEKLPTRGHGR